MESQFRNLVIDAIFPRFCASCHKEGSLWCVECKEIWSFKPLAPACGFCHREGSEVTCLSCKSTTYLDGLTAFGPYANPVIRSMLHSWKYIGDRDAEPVLQQWLYRDADRLGPPMLPFHIVPVSLHEKRKRVRGFDQAYVLATWIEKMYGLPIFPLLKRSIHTTPQAKVSGDKRKLGELDQIFTLDPEYKGPIPKHILLCDDVFTSGATMDAGAKILKESGAETVWGFVIARGK